MNFNPMEEQSLMGLLTALRGGLPASTGYGLLQDVLMGQAQRQDERQARVQGLIDMVTQGAQQGMSYDNAQMIASAQTGGNLPPRVEGAFETLYPPEAQPMGNPPPGFIGPTQAPVQGPPTFAPMQQSPVAQEAQAVSQTPQDILAALDLQDRLTEQQALSVTAPAIANGFASRALSMVGAPSPTTGQPMGPQEILSSLLQHESFTTLDPVTQAAVVEAVQTALASGGAAAAPAEQGGLGAAFAANPEFASLIQQVLEGQ